MAIRWIVAHGDCDGICSAAISLAVNPEAEVFFSHPAGLARDLADIERGDLILCDIAVSRGQSEELKRELRRLADSWEVTYVDHHPIPRGFVEDLRGVRFVVGEEETSSSELTWRLFEHLLPVDMSRVAIYGAIADYSDDTPTVRKLLESWDKRELFLESGLLVEALEGRRKRDYEFKRRVVQLLSRNLLPSSEEDIFETAVKERAVDEEKRKLVAERTRTLGGVAYVLDPGWALGKAATYARVFGGALLGVAGETRDKTIDLSVRGICEIDLGEVVEAVALELGGSGGGHRRAAGARIPVGSFEEFIGRLSFRASEIGGSGPG
jgi:RecJ-like exonuclease